MKRPRNSIIGFIATIGIAVSGCGTVPVSSFEESEDGEIVETEAQKSSAGWWLGAAALVVAAVALSKSDGDSAPAGRNCYWVISGNGSQVQVCD